MAAAKKVTKDAAYWLEQWQAGNLNAPTREDLAAIQEELLSAKRAAIAKDAELSRVSNELSDLNLVRDRLEACYSSVEDAFLRGT